MAEPKLNDMRVIKDPHAEHYYVERFTARDKDYSHWVRIGAGVHLSKEDALAWIEREKLAPIVVAEIPA